MSLARSRALRPFVALLTLASLVHVGILFPRFFTIAGLLPAEGRAVAWAVLLTVVTAVGACVLALVLVARSWDRAGARSLALFLAFLASVWGSLLRFLTVDVTERQADVTLSGEGWPAVLAVGGLLLAVAAFVRFTSLFPVQLSAGLLGPPRRLAFLRRARVLLLRPGMVWGVALALALLWRGAGAAMDLLADPAALASGQGPPLLVPFLLVTGTIVGIIPLAGIALGVRNLASGYRLASPEDRGRVLWLVTGVSAAGWMILGGLGTFLLVILLDLPAPEWIPVVLLALPICSPAVAVMAIAVALFHSGAVDPGLVLRRSTVYGALGALGIILFAGLENALSEWVESRLGFPGVVGSLLAGSVVAGVMIPMRNALGRAASRILPGQGSERTRG